MWLILATISLLVYTITDMVGKKSTSNNPLSILKLLITFYSFAFVISIILCIFNLGESGNTPWQLVANNPIFIACSLSSSLYYLCFLIGIYFVGLTVAEAIGGTTSIFYFCGLIFINLVTGKVATIREMLTPLRLIPIIIVLIFVFLLPNIEMFANKKTLDIVSKTKEKRKKMIIGIVFIVLSVLFDAVDSLITTTLLDDKEIGMIDIIMTNYFLVIIPLLVLIAIVFKKQGKVFISIKETKYYLLYSVCAVASMFTYTLASSFDAVRTGILFIAFPIFPIIFSRILLKEKYTFKQYICIYVIAISSIAFCIIDTLL